MNTCLQSGLKPPKTVQNACSCRSSYQSDGGAENMAVQSAKNSHVDSRIVHLRVLLLHLPPFLPGSGRPLLHIPINHVLVGEPKLNLRGSEYSGMSRDHQTVRNKSPDCRVPLLLRNRNGIEGLIKCLVSVQHRWMLRAIWMVAWSPRVESTTSGIFARTGRVGCLTMHALARSHLFAEV
jgi:hypothetical protein